MKSQYIEKVKLAFCVLLLICLTVSVFLVEDIFLPTIGLKMPVYLLIPLTVSVAMHLKDLPAMFYGIFTGALFDLMSSTTDGIYTLLFAVLSLLISGLTQKIFRNSRNVAFLFTLIFTLFICILSFSLNFLTGDATSPFLIIKGFYIPCFIVTAMLSPVFYPVSVKIIGIKNERI